ncbi:Mur ligase family protein [Patescibacteria group bacterium]|nr:Mur ligase family protein [Patescibacteria group bacterium]MCL5114193.1 Mur ligase family protein [Patescibacteria group bacterium]
MKHTTLKILSLFLKWIAHATIAKYRPSIVGVTGNVGKTSTKTAIARVLAAERRVRTASKNFNNELGLPVTIIGDFKDTGGTFFWITVIAKGMWQLIRRNNTYPEMLVLEYGVDRPGDMNYLLAIARPDVGIITAIGETPVHIEFFDGPEGIAKEKSKLIAQLPSTGFAILNVDDKHAEFFKEQTRGHVITYGFGNNADVRITAFGNAIREDNENGFVSFKLNYGGSMIPVKIEGVLGKSTAYAAAAAAATGLIFGMNLLKIAEALGGFKNPPGRENVIPGIKNSIVIDDSYNASPKATEEALATLKSIEAKRKVAVLGDMLELGRYTMEAHQKIGRLAAKSADILVTVGTRAKFTAEEAIKAGMPKRNVMAFENLNDASRELKNLVRHGDVVLVKGSQSVRMEKITKDIMRDPLEAEKLLVRQSSVWLAKPGLYE